MTNTNYLYDNIILMYDWIQSHLNKSSINFINKSKILLIDLMKNNYLLLRNMFKKLFN